MTSLKRTSGARDGDDCKMKAKKAVRDIFADSVDGGPKFGGQKVLRLRLYHRLGAKEVGRPDHVARGRHRGQER